ncbi:MAG: sulfite exporter TauE/SafE family protein [Actinomycetota bacterium]|nr:sulfite exporter TauE/SafE family protein [Actinomycetota bacterium]
MTLFIYLVVTGFFAGFIGSVIGIGGGVIMVPLMVLVLDIPIHFALGSSIVAVLATSVAGSRRYIRQKLTNVNLGLSLVPFTAAGGIIGGLVASRLQSNILLGILGGFVLVMTYIIYRKNSKGTEQKVTGGSGNSLFGSSYYDHALQKQISYDPKNLPYGLGASLAAGMASGLLGIGGGAIKVPALNLLMGLPLKAATATSNFMIGITAAASSIIYITGGYVNPFITAALVIGVLAGGTLGSHVAARVKNIVIVRIMLVVFTLIGINLLLKAWGVNLY